MNLSEEQIEAAQDLVDEHGLVAAATMLDVSPASLGRAIHGDAVRRGTVAVISIGLAQLAESDEESDEGPVDIEADDGDDGDDDSGDDDDDDDLLALDDSDDDDEYLGEEDDDDDDE